MPCMFYVSQKYSMFCFKTFLLELILSISVVSIYRWIDGVIDQMIDGQTNEQDQKVLFFFTVYCVQ